ncbi:MAG: hypothetical protein ACLUPB_15335 [Agathobacter rectalis]
MQFRNVATVGGSIWGRFGFSDVMTIFRALGAGAASQGRNYGFGRVCGTSKNHARCARISNSAEKCKGRSILKPETSQQTFLCSHVQWQIETAGMWRSSEHHHMAEPVWDKDGILDGIVDAKTHGNVALKNPRTMQK